jgi:hypothetical protein
MCPAALNALNNSVRKDIQSNGLIASGHSEFFGVVIQAMEIEGWTKSSIT